MTARKASREETANFERTLPHNLEAERSVLGSILLHADAYDRAAEFIVASDFHRDAHRRIFLKMAALANVPGRVIDFVTLKEELGRTGELTDVGGPAYITALVDGVPRSTNVSHYAKVVKEKATLRNLIGVANRILSDAYEAAQPPGDLLEQADRLIVDLQRGARIGRALDLSATAADLMADLEYRVQHRGELTGVDTGFASINDLTLGWQAGDLNIIAARPSIGKTAFAMNTAAAGAKTGKRVGVFSFEMRRRQLELRLLAQASAVSLERLRRGTILEEHWARLSKTVSEIGALPMIIDDRAGQTVANIRAACRLWKADGGLDLVVIDYVQLIPGSLERRGATRNEEVTDISRRLKQLADDCAISILLLSQMSRAGESRTDPQPKLSDLRESGSLEQDADNVCFLHRKKHREGGTTQFILEKQRNGSTGSVNLTLDRETTCFVDGGEDPPPPTKTETEEQRTRAIIRHRAKRR